MPYHNRVEHMGHVVSVTKNNNFIKLVLKLKENYKPKDGEAKDTFAEWDCGEKYGASLLDLNPGALIFVEGESRGREYNGRYYNGLYINKIAILWKQTPKGNNSSNQTERQHQQPPLMPQNNTVKSNASPVNNDPFSSGSSSASKPNNPTPSKTGDFVVEGVDDDIPF